MLVWWDAEADSFCVNGDKLYFYNSLAGLEGDWEDYEETKYFWCISIDGSINKYEVERYAHESWCKNGAKSIGNYFETKEEAERAMEKLKAWKMLKDEEFTISGWSHTPDMNLTTGSFITIKGFIPRVEKNIKNLDLIFGG